MLVYISQLQFLFLGWFSSVKWNIRHQIETTEISWLRIDSFLSTWVLCSRCSSRRCSQKLAVRLRRMQWSVIHAVVSWNVLRKLRRILEAHNVQDIPTYTWSSSLEFASRPNIKCDNDGFLVSAACNRSDQQKTSVKAEHCTYFQVRRELPETYILICKVNHLRSGFVSIFLHYATLA